MHPTKYAILLKSVIVEEKKYDQSPSTDHGKSNTKNKDVGGSKSGVCYWHKQMKINT